MRALLVSVFMIGSFYASGQQFGGFSPATRWQQINSDTARIIFSPAAASEAQRVATILHKMAADNNSLGGPLKKINVVLHNNTTLANGYVALAPFRSEYYLVPGGNVFDFGNLPWQEQLAIHEYRHVQQYNHFNRGLSKASGIILGQEGRALANALSVPDWFFEGDAVYAETVLTPQGRGRMPFFLNGYNSLWKEGRNYNWMKLRNGSLKDYVPNHYQLGYLLVNYGYKKYGEEFWKKVTADASDFKGLLYPFQKAVSRHSGVAYKVFREAALKEYSHEIAKRRDDLQQRETVTNYYFPQQIGEDSLLYLKESYKTIAAFYVKDKDGEHKIKQRNISSEDWFSYRNGTIAYTAYSTHARWSLQDFSDVILLDIATGKEEKITSKSKYYTPDISPDGNMLIAISVNDSVQSQLHWLDRTGRIIKAFPAAANSFFIQPKFIDAKRVVVGIRWPDATISLEELDLATGITKNLLPPTIATIGFPFVKDDFVFFTASYQGNDDICRLSLADKSIAKLTTGQTGNYFPSVYKDTLRWSEFTSNGYRLRESGLSALKPATIPLSALAEVVFPVSVAGEEQAENILATKTKEYAVQPYEKSTGLFNFHSWRPNYEDPEFTFSVYSDNVLNTFSNEVYYRYNQNELSNTIGFNTAYGGLYPVIRGGLEFTYNRQVETVSNTYTFNQYEAKIGYYIPLNFTQGTSFKFLSFGSDVVYNNLTPTGASKALIKSDNTAYLSHFLNWSQQRPMARQHIFPKLGYALNGNYRHRVTGKGYQSLTNAQLYLPALLPNHSLVLSGGFQQTDTNNVIFSNRFANSRGYEDYYFSRMWKASANYHLPLLYPDRGFANIVYLLRVRSNLFYDCSRVYSRNKQNTRDFRSVGTEILFDTKWWNQLPVSFGVRYSYLLDDELTTPFNRNRFEFILPLNLIPD